MKPKTKRKLIKAAKITGAVAAAVAGTAYALHKHGEHSKKKMSERREKERLEYIASRSTPAAKHQQAVQDARMASIDAEIRRRHAAKQHK